MKKNSTILSKAALLLCCLMSLVGLTFAQTTYTFSNYPAGEQYAENEVHVLDDDMTLVTNQCHFTTQLRVYSSSSHDGYFYSYALPLYIDSIAFNMGYKVDNVNIYGSVDGDNWNLVGTIAVTSTSYSDYGLSFGSSNYNFFKFDVAGSQQIRVASMTMYYKSTGPSGQTAQIPTFSPAAGLYTSPISVTIATETANASIYYTTDGSTPSTNSTLYTAPFTISQTTTVKAIATADGYANSSVATATYSFPEVLANLAAFKTLPNSNQPYIIGNDVTFVFGNGAYTYVKDASAGLLLYGNNGIVNDFSEGDQIANLMGTKTTYQNQVEMTVSAYESSSAANVGTITPITLTISELKNNYSTYDAQLVKIENVTFPDGFTGGNSTIITQGDDSLTMYKRFSIDTTIAAGSTLNITGFAAIYGSTIQLYPRNNQDFTIQLPTVETPVFTPVAGSYADSVTFSITCATEGAEIRYTTDSTEPTENSALYSAPVTLTSSATVMAKAFKTNWLPSETSTAVYTVVYEPVLSVNPSVLSFNSTQLTQTFTVSGAYLTDPVTLTSSDSHFTVSPSSISNPNSTTEVTVTFDGTEPATGTVAVVSGTLSEQVALNATARLAAPTLTPVTETSDDAITVTMSCIVADAAIHYTVDGTEPTENSAVYSLPLVFSTPGTYTVKALATKAGWEASEVSTGNYTINQPASNDTVIYSVGFEDEEGFTASNVYNNTTVEFTGAEGAQWGTFYGTPSTNNHIAGAQSMQMRWYTSATENIGYTYTNFDLHNVTHVTFAAASTNGLNVKVSHSTDGGSTYSAGQVFTLGSTAQVFNYVVDEEGSYNFVRLKFAIELPETDPTSTSRVVIDSLVAFGIPGVVPSTVATPVISPNNGFYYEPQTVSITCSDADAVIRYTTDGTEPTENSTLYSQPFTVSATTTISAKAWKANMTPSFTATSTISFPAQVANIAAFKTAASNDPQQIMSDVTFVFRSGRYMFVEDNTAAMLIYDNSTPVITTTYNEGDVIEAGIFGKYSTYQGMVEMVPTHNANEATGTPVTVTPANATITDIKAQYTDVYESKLVHLSDVEFISATQFVQNGDTMAIYNRFNTVNTEITAGDMADVTGFVSYSTNYGYQIYPRGDEDIDIHPVVIMDTVATPEFDLFKDGEFYRVNITCATEGASIYYTIDGTDPDESSNLFDGIFPLNMQPRILKAIAMKEGMVNSAIAVYDYNPSGINSYELRDNLSVYPNPAINNIIISVKNDNVTIEKVELYNIYGQLLNTMYVNGNTTEVSVQALATGTYLAKVYTDKGVVTMPVIKK